MPLSFSLTAFLSRPSADLAPLHSQLPPSFSSPTSSSELALLFNWRQDFDFKFVVVETANLSLTLCSAIDTGLAAAELDKRSEFLVLASVIFSRYHEIESSILRGVAQQGAKVIS